MAKSLQQFKAEFDPSQEVIFLRQRVQELERGLRQEKSAHGESRELMLALSSAIEQAEPVKMVYKPTKKPSAPCTHVLHLTDLHWGEVTKADEVEGFNEYNSAIAERRIQQLGAAILKVTETQRAGYSIPHLHILGTADYISGDIHHELQVTNEFPCPVQAVKCGYAIGGLIAMFAPYFETVTADFITLDNHGRITTNYQSSEGGQNNWSYVVAEVAKQHVKQIANVAVNVHAKATALVPIGPEKYLLFHGHQMKGWAGKPYYGFDRRVAMEAVKRMGASEQAFTKLIFGHFHTATNEKDWQLGGSLSGTNAFDHSNGRHCQAHQTSWLVHPEHGEFSWTRWWLS